MSLSTAGRGHARQLLLLVCVRMLALQFAFRIGKCLCASKCSDLGQLKDPWIRGYDPWRPEGTNRRIRTREKKRTPVLPKRPIPTRSACVRRPACYRAPRCRVQRRRATNKTAASVSFFVIELEQVTR